MARAKHRIVWVVELNNGTKAAPRWSHIHFHAVRESARRKAASYRKGGWPVRVVKYTPAG